MEALSDPKAFLQAQEEKRVAQVIYCKIIFLKIIAIIYCIKILLQLKNYDIDEDEIDDSNVVHGSTKNNKRSVMPGPAKPPIFPGQRTKAPEEKGNFYGSNSETAHF